MSEPTGLRKISSNLIELLKNKQQTEPSYSKKKSKTKIDIYDGPAEMFRKQPTPRSATGLTDRGFSNLQRTPTNNGNGSSIAYEKLIHEAITVVHIKKDLSYLPHLKSSLDKTTVSATGLSIGSKDSRLLNASISDLRNTVEACERQKYENAFRRQLLTLLTALELPNPQTLLTQDISMELLAHEIKKHLQVDQKSPALSSRAIKRVSSSQIEDPEENQSELRRLKGLVVKLQNEINELNKKSTHERIKELYDDNLNYQRKISDLIDQLKRKEQDFLLIPIGKIAQDRLDTVQRENEELKKQLEELQKKYYQDLGDFESLKKNMGKISGQVPGSNEVYLDPHLLLTVIEQKQALVEANDLIITLRAERDQFQTSIKTVETDKYELAKRAAILENLTYSAGLEVPDGRKPTDDLSVASIQETPRGVSEERFELSHQLENLMTLKSQLNKIKEEIHKTG